MRRGVVKSWNRIVYFRNISIKRTTKLSWQNRSVPGSFVSIALHAMASSSFISKSSHGILAFLRFFEMLLFRTISLPDKNIIFYFILPHFQTKNIHNRQNNHKVAAFNLGVAEAVKVSNGKSWPETMRALYVGIGAVLDIWLLDYSWLLEILCFQMYVFNNTRTFNLVYIWLPVW